MTDGTAKILYLPVETAARELDAKLLLALFALREGFEVVLGSRPHLHLLLHKLPPGMYLAHNVDVKRRRTLGLVHRLGHLLIGWDEEGLVWLSPQAYRQRRISTDSLRLLESFYAWGQEQAEALHPLAMATSLKVLGNPRADLLRKEFHPLYEERVAQLRMELGDFILINSNFGWLHYRLKEDWLDEPEEVRLRKLSELSGHPLPYLQYRQRVFESFRQLLAALARAFPERAIVVRPHPSESARPWQQAAAGLDNVQVRYDDDLVPWLLAARAIIHNGCTTAVEAALLGRAPISHEEVPDSDGGMPPQPAAVSLRARNAQDVIDIIRAGGTLGEPQRAALRRMVANYGADWLSAQRIAADMATIARARPVPARASPPAAALAWLRAQGQPVAWWWKGKGSYHDRKFPPQAMEQIPARLAALARLAGLQTPVMNRMAPRVIRLCRAGAQAAQAGTLSRRVVAASGCAADFSADTDRV